MTKVLTLRDIAEGWDQLADLATRNRTMPHSAAGRRWRTLDRAAQWFHEQADREAEAAVRAVYDGSYRERVVDAWMEVDASGFEDWSYDGRVIN